MKDFTANDSMAGPLLFCDQCEAPRGVLSIVLASRADIDRRHILPIFVEYLVALYWLGYVIRSK